jgi:hypothetical protein
MPRLTSLEKGGFYPFCAYLVQQGRVKRLLTPLTCYVLITNLDWDSSTGTTPVYLINMNDEIEQRFDLEVLYSSFEMSPDERSIAYLSEGALIYNINEMTYTYVRPDANSYFSVGGGKVTWHPNGEWLLLFEDALKAGGGNIRHLGITNRDGTLRRDLSDSYDPQPNVGCDA